MFNPLNWFRRGKRYSESEVSTIIDRATSNLNYTFNAKSPLSWKDLFGNHHPRDFAKDRTQMTLAAIYCAVNTYIGAITSLPRFCQKINPSTQRPLRFVKTTDHPASRIWSHYANDELSSNELLKLMVYDILFQDGNFYALPEYDSFNRIARVHYIHPSRIPRGNIIRAQGDEKLSNGRLAPRGKLIYKVIESSYEDTQNPQGFILLRDEIIHIKGLIPDPEAFRSQGIMENNARSAGLYDSSEEMGAKFYSRGHTNQMFLSTEHQLAPKVRTELERSINNTVTGGTAIEDIFKTKVLEHGLKPIHVGMPLQAMQFIETRAFSVEDVARWFNMPAFLLHSMMGTGSGTAQSDKLMVMWIQSGLGHFLNNLAEQFRDQLLPRHSQPLFRFEFQRLHLYKTVLNDFSQALRNVFEVGGIDRLDMAALLGIHLDPSDPTNSQRYVPANLLTVDHSLLLEKKAKTSITVMEENILQLTQTREMEAEAAEEAKIAREEADLEYEESEEYEEPEEAIKREEEDDDPDQSQDEPRQDKRTRPVPEGGTINFDPAVQTALWNTLFGLHEYELRVMNQKQKSRSADWREAMGEWYPRFEETLNSKLEPWAEVLTYLGLADKKALTQDWITSSRAYVSSSDNVENSIKENFHTIFSCIKGEENEQAGN